MLITFLKKHQTKLGFLISIFALQIILIQAKKTSKNLSKVINKSCYVIIN